jgi:luciferase family oxidoreductase group 1
MMASSNSIINKLFENNMIPFSILDLTHINEGQTIPQAFEQTAQLAVTAESLGYKRIWLAEHHASRGIASAATAVVLSHIGAKTKSIRIGAGGIMLPNHAPLAIAEQFGTLASLYGDRIDLGLGRAPGTDMATARALRRKMDSSVDEYPSDIQELQRYLGSPEEGQRVIAIPGVDTHVPLWLLGSSLYSAQLAAQLGLPYAFASHFAPDQLLDAIKIYRRYFQPSGQLEKPYVMVGVMVVCAETDEEAEFHFTSVQQKFVQMQRGSNSAFPPPVKHFDEVCMPHEKHFVNQSLRLAITGSKETTTKKLEQLIEGTQADELIVSIPVYSSDAKLKTLDMLSDIGFAKAA